MSAMPTAPCVATPPAIANNVSASVAAFWSVLTLPNGSVSRPHWAQPITRSRRFFCCGTMQRAFYSCACLQLPRGPKESWPYCLDHSLTRRSAPLPSHAVAAAAAPSAAPIIGSASAGVGGSLPCLVYSFGIANQWEFDDTMADRGCEVHSFDPTGSTMAVHLAHAHPTGRVHFHPWGLSTDLRAAHRGAPAACAGDASSGPRGGG